MNLLTLNNDVVMPALGLGVFQTPPEETRAAVAAALGTGYRHIDTAAAYGNEREVGEAVHSSSVERGDRVATTPGSISVTRTWGRSSCRNDSVQPFKPHLAAA
jgi:diketogulonate reductase-like aldo/keto reductase